MLLIGLTLLGIGVFLADIINGGTLDELQGLITKKGRK